MDMEDEHCFLIEDIEIGKHFQIMSLEKGNVFLLSQLPYSVSNDMIGKHCPFSMSNLPVCHIQNSEAFPLSEGNNARDLICFLNFSPTQTWAVLGFSIGEGRVL